MKRTLETSADAFSLADSVSESSPGAKTAPSHGRAVICVRDSHRDLIYPPQELARAAEWVEIVNPQGPVPPEAWPKVDFILGGWNMPKLTADFLAAAPNLRAVFYGAGSVRGFMTDEAWERGVTVTTAAQANSETTAEFCLSLVLFSLKHGWPFVRNPREAYRNKDYQHRVPGLFGTRVGLVSFGRVARRLAALLRHLPLEVVCWDPLQPPEVLQNAGVKPCDLPTLFATSHVVSLHTPWLPETEDLVGGDLLATLRPGATLINTSRGAVIDEKALIDLLRRRADLTAVLDVTREEPLAADSPFYDLPNVILTPHIAGACGPECRRLGASAIDELIRFTRGEPLQHSLTREAAAVMA